MNVIMFNASLLAHIISKGIRMAGVAIGLTVSLCVSAQTDTPKDSARTLDNVTVLLQRERANVISSKPLQSLSREELTQLGLQDLADAVKKFAGAQVKDITVLQYIHDKHIIHRDIKPDNFVMGLNKQNADLFLLDFGLAKKYRSSKTLEQYPYIKKKKLTGTARYASIHALEEMEQSRRDDLESVGYVLMYFLRGNLPWQGLKVKSKEDRYKKILDKKKETTSEQLCKNFPDEFREYLEYSRNLEYTEQPKYDKLKNKFYNLVCNKMGDNFDYVYDWTTENDIKKRKSFIGNGIELKTTTTKDVEIKSKKKAKDGEKVDVNNSFNNIPISNNNLNQVLMKEDENEILKMEDNNIVNDKVDSRCCLM